MRKGTAKRHETPCTATTSAANDVSALSAENARLRKALRKIKDTRSATFAIAIATEALSVNLAQNPGQD